MLGSLPLHILAEKTLTGPASSHTFTLSALKVPAWARHLVVLLNARLDVAATVGTVSMTFNGDSGANYNRQRLSGSGSTADANRASAESAWTLANAVPGALATAGVLGGGTVLVPHFAGTTDHKSALFAGGPAEDGVTLVAGRWASTSAIASVQVSHATGNFVAGSYFALGVVDERFRVAEDLLAADGTVTFGDIPQQAGDLVAVGYCRTDRDIASKDGIRVAINGDTTNANYGLQQIEGDSAAAQAASSADRIMGIVTGDTATPNAFGAFCAVLSQFADGVNQPVLLGVSGFHEAVTPNSIVRAASVRRSNTAAVTSLAFAPSAGTNFKAGSLFSLYLLPKRLIARTVLAADAPSVTFTVPPGYASMQALWYARSAAAAASDGVGIEFNGDTTDANYDLERLGGSGATLTAMQSAAGKYFWSITGDTAAANRFGGGGLSLPQYDKTDRHKHQLAITAPESQGVYLFSCRWENAAAVTSIVFKTQSAANFKAGSVFELWGVMSAAQISTQRRSRMVLLRRAQDGKP